jgi:hypothetical protein
MKFIKAATAALLLTASLNAYAAPAPAAMMTQMRAAFGGERLMSLTSARMKLHMLKVGETLPQVVDMHYDFKGRAIEKTESSESGIIRRQADGEHGFIYVGDSCEPMEERDEDKLMRSLYGNFLFLLTDTNTIMTPPEGTPPVGAELAGLAWYNIYRPGWKGYHVGVDEESGLIRGLWFGDKSTGEELEYRMVDGVMWPHRFRIFEEGKLVSEGWFTDVSFSRTGQDGIRVPDYCMQLLTPKR